MSLQEFQKQTLDALQTEIDRRVTSAVNVRAVSYETTDKLALHQIEIISEARAMLEAQKIIQKVFKTLTNPGDHGKVEETAKPLGRKDIY